MSFILDALKKSEAERQRQAGPALFEAPSATPRRGIPTWVIATGAVLVLANLLGLLWVLQRDPTAAVSPTPVAATTAPVATLPAAAATAGTSATPVGNDSPVGALIAPLEPDPSLADAPEPPRIANLKHYAALGTSAPVLRLDLHVYSSDRADRYALINMRKLREGETTEDGIVVKEITRSGVVLLYRGEELLLARE